MSCTFDWSVGVAVDQTAAAAADDSFDDGSSGDSFAGSFGGDLANGCTVADANEIAADYITAVDYTDYYT